MITYPMCGKMTNSLQRERGWWWWVLNRTLHLWMLWLTGWLADWLTDWPPVRSDGKQYIKEIVSYNHVVPLFWIYEESLGSELFFQHIFKFFETNRNQRIVSPGYFKNSKNIWGWGNQMATYEKTKKKINWRSYPSLIN